MRCCTIWIRLFVLIVDFAAISHLATAATLPNLRFLPGQFPLPSSEPIVFFETVEITTSNNGVVLEPMQSGVVLIGGSGTPDPAEPQNLPTAVIAPSAVVEFGSGAIHSHVTNHGSITPGTFTSAGDLMIAGDLSHETEGYLYFEISGTDMRDNDLLRVLRSFSLKGKVRIVFTHGYAPAAGDVIPLVSVGEAISFHSYSAEKFEFANVTDPPIYEISISNNLVGLMFYNNSTFIPEPSGISIASFVVALCITSRRRL